MRSILKIVIIIFLIIQPVNAIAITYRSHIDTVYGFYRVIDETTHKPSPYENRILTINIEDKVIWYNEDTGTGITIVNKQRLWNDIYLRKGQQFNYTFNNPGTYDIYIKEYPQIKQKIIVNDINIPTNISSGDNRISSDKPTSTNIPIVPNIIPNITTPIYTSLPNESIYKSNLSPIYSKFLVMAIIAIISTIILIKVLSGKKIIDKRTYNIKKGEKKNDIRIEEESYPISRAQKISGALCYSLGFLSGLAFLILSRKENNFVRFHAIQSSITFLSLFMISTILMENKDIEDIFGPLFIIIDTIIWIVLMIKAYQGKIYKLPIIGDIAKNRL